MWSFFRVKPHCHKLDSYLLSLGEEGASGSEVEFGFLDLGTVSQPCSMDILSCTVLHGMFSRIPDLLLMAVITKTSLDIAEHSPRGKITPH